MHVFDHGDGTPVVLLHGLPSPPQDLERLAFALPGPRVLVPHLPGYGKSAPTPGHQGAAAIEQARVATLAAKRVERPVLVGYSMGAYRAIAIAERVGARAVLALAGFWAYVLVLGGRAVAAGETGDLDADRAGYAVATAG